MEVNGFEILLIDVTFYSQHVQKLVFTVLIKKWKPAIKQLFYWTKRKYVNYITTRGAQWSSPARNNWKFRTIFSYRHTWRLCVHHDSAIGSMVVSSDITHVTNRYRNKDVISHSANQIQSVTLGNKSETRGRMIDQITLKDDHVLPSF